ncbi:MAG: DUF2383 domain-containing protein [Myxococcales bacterium]|jgi:uncharacterized protein (TIGR02284 family)|nr:DUF2383 domain-containing protein [Myxococcales bacterium]
MNKDIEKDIKQLNSFLRGELSAVQSYDQCLEKIESPQLGDTLRELRQSHLERARLLEQKVSQLGGKPSKDTGAWGGFAKLVERGATAFGEKAAIMALEEGEDHGRDDYKRDIGALSAECQAFVRGRIMPEQQRTHDTVSRLKKQLQN